MLRSIPAEFASVGWPSRVLEQLGALHLLIQAHRRLEDLPILRRPCAPASAIRSEGRGPRPARHCRPLVRRWHGGHGRVPAGHPGVALWRASVAGRDHELRTVTTGDGRAATVVLALSCRPLLPALRQFRALVGEQTSACRDDRCWPVIHRRTRSLGRLVAPIRGLPDAGSDQCSSRAEPWLVCGPPVANAARSSILPRSPGPCSLVPAASRSRSSESGLPAGSAVELARDGCDRTVQHRRCGTGGVTKCQCGKTS